MAFICLPLTILLTSVWFFMPSKNFFYIAAGIYTGNEMLTNKTTRVILYHLPLLFHLLLRIFCLISNTRANIEAFCTPMTWLLSSVASFFDLLIFRAHSHYARL